MIDLHIHSNNSDGSDSIKEIVEKANKLDLKAISITDHNKVGAYFSFNLKQLKRFNGQIITGVELSTSYKGIAIEILAYNFNPNILIGFIKKHYPSFKRDKKRRLELTLKKLKSAGIVLNETVLRKVTRLRSVSGSILTELKSYKQNMPYINNKKLLTKSKFARNYLENPKSNLYIDYSELYPTLEEIVDKVHQAGGVCLLAHPYEYNMDVEKNLDKIFNNYLLDGIECYYPKFTKEQTNYLLDFCNRKNLLVSGGSDYHGKNRDNKLGTGINNNLNIKQNHVRLQLDERKKITA